MRLQEAIADSLRPVDSDLGEQLEEELSKFQSLATSAVNTQGIVGLSLPWSMVGVQRSHGVNRSTPLLQVDQEDVRAKANLWGYIISVVYPEWILT